MATVTLPGDEGGCHDDEVDGSDDDEIKTIEAVEVRSRTNYCSFTEEMEPRRSHTIDTSSLADMILHKKKWRENFVMKTKDDLSLKIKDKHEGRTWRRPSEVIDWIRKPENLKAKAEQIEEWIRVEQQKRNDDVEKYLRKSTAKGPDVVDTRHLRESFDRRNRRHSGVLMKAKEKLETYKKQINEQKSRGSSRTSSPEAEISMVSVTPSKVLRRGSWGGFIEVDKKQKQKQKLNGLATSFHSFLPNKFRFNSAEELVETESVENHDGNNNQSIAFGEGGSCKQFPMSAAKDLSERLKQEISSIKIFHQEKMALLIAENKRLRENMEGMQSQLHDQVEAQSRLYEHLQESFIDTCADHRRDLYEMRTDSLQLIRRNVLETIEQRINNEYSTMRMRIDQFCFRLDRIQSNHGDSSPAADAVIYSNSNSRPKPFSIGIQSLLIIISFINKINSWLCSGNTKGVLILVSFCLFMMYQYLCCHNGGVLPKSGPNVYEP